MFYDRLVEPQEQEWFLDTLRKMTASHFRMPLDSLLSHLVTLQPGESKATGVRTGERCSPGPRALRVLAALSVVTQHHKQAHTNTDATDIG